MEDFIFDLQRFEDSKFSGGDGSENNPYKITNADQLKEVGSNLDKHFKLMNDIELSGGWTPIGNSSNKFIGTFDGNDKTIIISNLTINSTSNYQGLFGFVGVNGTVSNCTVSGGTVTAKDSAAQVGGVVGYNAGTVSNCAVSGTVTAKDSARVGGVVGYNAGTVSNCSTVSGTVTATKDSAQIGGVVGRNDGEVSNCAATNVNALGTGNDARVGGVVGRNYQNGSISGSAYLGGTLKGTNKGAIAGGQNSNSTLTDNYYYGTLDDDVNRNSAMELKRIFTVPSGVTCKGEGVVQFGNICGTTADSVEVTFTCEGLAFNNKAEQEETIEEFAKKAQKATAVTLQSSFEGTIIKANDYRKLTTIKTAKNFTSDIKIIGNTKANVISSGAGDDTINSGRKADTLTGGDGADTFIYADGDGRDTIKDYSSEDVLQISGEVRKASVSGKKVVLKVGAGSITLEKAVGQKITYTDDENRTEVTNIYRTEGKYDEDETSLKIFSTFADTFKASAYKNLETIDGGAVKFEAIEIVGNDRDNSITGGSKTDNLSGGAGSDTLDGGKGADYLDGGDGDDSLNGGTGFDTLIGGAGDDSLTGDAGQNVFVYESGDDVITDFSAGTANKIQLLNDSVTTDYSFSGEDLTLNFGNGSLTIQDYDGGEVRFLDAKGNKSSYVFTANALLNANRTSATLATNNFTATDKISTIDARQISGSVNIEGNERANKIYANDDGGTYTGGTGNDKFWGGKGSDTFIYADGDGRDVIYGFDNNDALEINGIDEITATYNAEKNYVRFKCGKGSIKLQDFTATEFAVNSDVWTLSGNTITKQ